MSTIRFTMDILKISQRLDALLAVGCLLAAGYFASKGSNVWAASMVASAAVSGLSAKYQPGKWLLRRLLLSRMK